MMNNATSIFTCANAGNDKVVAQPAKRAMAAQPHEIVDIVAQNRTAFWRSGMNISAKVTDERVLDVRCDAHSLIVDLMNGRTISVPLAWYPRLLHATPDQRAKWELAGAGYGIHWSDIDEDLSTAGLLRGAPAPKVA